jgi:hypothetical protein
MLTESASLEDQLRILSAPRAFYCVADLKRNMDKALTKGLVWRPSQGSVLTPDTEAEKDEVSCAKVLKRSFQRVFQVAAQEEEELEVDFFSVQTNNGK